MHQEDVSEVSEVGDCHALRILWPSCRSFLFLPFSAFAIGWALLFLFHCCGDVFLLLVNAKCFRPQPWGVGTMSWIYPRDRVEPAKMGLFKLRGDKSFFFLPFSSQRIAGEVCCAKCLECISSPLLPPSKQKEYFILWKMLIGEYKSKPTVQHCWA